LLDQTDRKIIECLCQNARMQWKEIGEKVHLTGQAVADRIRRLEEKGIIQGYTARLNLPETNHQITAFITVFMKTNSNHSAFQRWIGNQEAVVEAHKVSGEGCYWLKVTLNSVDVLNELLDEILSFGNYRLNMSIAALK